MIERDRALPRLHQPFVQHVQQLEAAKLLPEDNLILIEGPVPGPKNQVVTIRGAVKKRGGKGIVPVQQPTKKKGGG